MTTYTKCSFSVFLLIVDWVGVATSWLLPFGCLFSSALKHLAKHFRYVSVIPHLESHRFWCQILSMYVLRGCMCSGIRSKAQYGSAVRIILQFKSSPQYMGSSLIWGFIPMQTKQSVEVVNPLARLVKVDEIRSDTMVDHILDHQPERYNEIRLREHEFLIAVQCQYATFKVLLLSICLITFSFLIFVFNFSPRIYLQRSLVAYFIINLDEVKIHHTEPPYFLLQRFLAFDGISLFIRSILRWLCTNSECTAHAMSITH